MSAHASRRGSGDRRLAKGITSAPGNATCSARPRSATSIASMPGGTRPGSGGTSARVNPSRAASARRRRDAGDPPDLAGQADLADRDQPGREGVVARGARDGERDREVGGRLGQADPADGGGVDVGRPERDLGPALEHGEHHRQPARRRARSSCAAGWRASEAATSAWTSATSGRLPSSVTVTQVPATGVAPLREEQAARVGQPDDAVVGEVEAADLVGGAVAVLDARGPCAAASAGRPRTAARRRRGARAGADRRSTPSLVTCPTSTVAMPRSLATPDQRGGDLADLADAARRAVDLGAGRPSAPSRRRAARGSPRRRGRATAAEVGLGGEQQVVVQGADALGAQPHLGGGLLAGDVERAAAPGEARRDLEQQRGLARRRALRRAAPPRPARARRRARGRARRPRSEGPVPPRRRPRRSAGRPRSPGRRRWCAPSGPTCPRPCPRPGTRRSGRPTCRRSTRTRRSGRRGARGSLSWPWRRD